MPKSIWIDLDNSPHVPLFIPFIQALEERGYDIIITARDYAQTLPLLEKYGIQYKVIGRHFGKRKLLKIIGMLVRSIQLIFFHNKNKNILGINHGSRSHVLACWFLNIPVYCGLDYEYTESTIFCKFATKIWIPEAISERGGNQICENISKIIRYKGLKENLYLQDFEPDLSFRQKLNISDSKILVTLRPPAELANYHDSKSEEIIVSLIQYLLKNMEVCVVFLPRTAEQNLKYQKYNSNSFIIPSIPLDGNNLVFHSDLVISGGGTMNREAIVLGTPVYSIFSGSKGSIDEQLEDSGRLVFIEGNEDIKKVILAKKEIGKAIINRNKLFLNELLDKLLDD